MVWKTAIPFLLLGLVFRIYLIQLFPQGFDIDESLILYWAKKTFLEGQFYAYSPATEGTGWEMIPGYIYYFFLSIFKTSPRYLAIFFGLSEVVLLGMFCRKLISKEAGWIAATFLMLTPWHIYYSGIVGTCTGVIGVVLFCEILLMVRGWTLKLISLPLSLGLLYYATFRLFFLKTIFFEFKNKKTAFSLVGAFLLTLMIVGVSQSEVKDFLTRGNYNYLNPNLNIFKNYFFSLIFPFFPIFESYSQTTDFFMADYVHVGLSKALAGIPPVTYVFLPIMGLILFGYKKNKMKPVKKSIGFLFFCWLCLGFMGPSLSRMLIVLPYLIIVGVFSLMDLKLRYSNKVFIVILIFLFSVMGVSDWFFLKNFNQNNQLESVFHSRFFKIEKLISSHEIVKEGEQAYLVADYGFQVVQYVQTLNNSFVALPPAPAEVIVDDLKSRFDGSAQYVFFDRVPKDASDLSGYDKLERVQAIERALLRESNVLEMRPVFDERLKEIGHYLKISGFN